jgi:hypothetical protein
MANSGRRGLNARRYEQIDGVHYDEDTKLAPVTNNTTIRIVFTLLALARWYAHVVDVQGAAFLNGRLRTKKCSSWKFRRDSRGTMGVSNTVLRLKRTIYGLKQAAFAFWKELLLAFESLKYLRSNADPCLYC